MSSNSAALQLAQVIGLDLQSQQVIGYTIRARVNGTTVTVFQNLKKVGVSSERFALVPISSESQASLTPLSSAMREGGQK